MSEGHNIFKNFEGVRELNMCLPVTLRLLLLIGMGRNLGQQAAKKEGIHKCGVKTYHHFFSSKSKVGIQKLNNCLVSCLRTTCLQAHGETLNS